MATPHMELVNALDTAFMVEDVPNSRYSAQLAAQVVRDNPDVVLRALGYEPFLHHGKTHNNDPFSSKCFPGCGQAWRNPNELIQ